KMPPAGYVPPAAPPSDKPRPAVSAADWTPAAMLGTWQFVALVFLFVGSAQAGLLVISNAARLLDKTAADAAFFATNAWILASYGGLVNAGGRVGTGSYS